MRKLDLRNYRANKLYGFHDKDIAVSAPIVEQPIKSSSEESSVVEMLYAPCPDTRLPDSSLPFKLSHSNQEAVKNIIKDFILRAHPHHQSQADSDTALDFVASRSAQYGNEVLEYQTKLTQAVQEDMQESANE